ncbi:hypothetical protein OsI_25666 [Oryza sativa Indica Group]|uniref:DUF7731 domain-containing protein n=1 Tax=Oryza sativa subsp. indica TaxID=39946 RepID=B8B579_ORYSI|nr:hypothetical protein OsI_25666 [Oryza sativa Indica Group]
MVRKEAPKTSLPQPSSASTIAIGCQGQYKLGPEGALRVPSTAAEAFCGGPCLAEANLVLGYVDAIMDSFRFYNGATIRDVRLTLDRGCGRSGGLRRVATPRR